MESVTSTPSIVGRSVKLWVCPKGNYHRTKKTFFGSTWKSTTIRNIGHVAMLSELSTSSFLLTKKIERKPEGIDSWFSVQIVRSGFLLAGSDNILRSPRKTKGKAYNGTARLPGSRVHLHNQYVGTKAKFRGSCLPLGRQLPRNFFFCFRESKKHLSQSKSNKLKHQLF